MLILQHRLKAQRDARSFQPQGSGYKELADDPRSATRKRESAGADAFSGLTVAGGRVMTSSVARHQLGNMQVIPLTELAGSAKQRAFGRAKRDTLPRLCRECPVYFACHGGCPKDRFSQTPEGEAGLNYLCAGYKAFFTHVDAPMRQMAALVRQGHPLLR